MLNLATGNTERIGDRYTRLGRGAGHEAVVLQDACRVGLEQTVARNRDDVHSAESARFGRRVVVVCRSTAPARVGHVECVTVRANLNRARPPGYRYVTLQMRRFA